MVDGIRTLFLSEAKTLKGADVRLTVVEGGLSREEVAHVHTVASVSKAGPCLITDHGDFPLDHVTSCETLKAA